MLKGKCVSSLPTDPKTFVSGQNGLKALSIKNFELLSHCL